MDINIKLFEATYHKVSKSIAFYPVLISIGFLIFGFVTAWLETLSSVKALKESIPQFIIEDPAVAETILSTLIGGIISLTVFSFTMVMVVLNQASANFSPRLLPDLIANKRHQIILGVYIGTLVYCFINLITLGASASESNDFGLAVMIAAILGLICLGLFVSFLHSISAAIQIHNIISGVYTDVEEKLEKSIEMEKESPSVTLENEQNWQVISLDRSGYYKGFETSLLNKEVLEKENTILVIPYPDAFLWEGSPVLKIKNKLNSKEIKSLLFALRISSDLHGEVTTLSGMIKLMEISVKALSPGINDPGTAIDAINKLGGLFRQAVNLPSRYSKNKDENNLSIIYNNVDFSQLMRIVVQPIRFYAKEDSSVLYQLIGGLQFAKQTPGIDKSKEQAINQELKAIQEDVAHYFTNEKDKSRILELFKT